VTPPSAASARRSCSPLVSVWLRFDSGMRLHASVVFNGSTAVFQTARTGSSPVARTGAMLHGSMTCSSSELGALQTRHGSVRLRSTSLVSWSAGPWPASRCSAPFVSWVGGSLARLRVVFVLLSPTDGAAPSKRERAGSIPAGSSIRAAFDFK
jgi:hypothetical protein